MTAIADWVIMRLEKADIVNVIHEKPAFCKLGFMTITAISKFIARD